MSDLAAFQTRLGYTFLDEGLLRLALTHPSVAHEQAGSSVVWRLKLVTGGRAEQAGAGFVTGFTTGRDNVSSFSLSLTRDESRCRFQEGFFRGWAGSFQDS